ncbi:MAG: QueT transporter family protein [Firmicutes bacterium]|nr:QueT transporter family protein [Bacillota bacterium]
MKDKTLKLTRAALIAALYVILTFLSQMFGLASGVIQFRLSEALTFMPMLYKESIWGLTIGCLIANVLTGCAFWDVIFGSIATLLGALGTYYIGRKIPILGPLFPILSNMLIVPAVLQAVYGAPESFWFLMITVGIGEIVCCGLMGFSLYKVFKKIDIQ